MWNERNSIIIFHVDHRHHVGVVQANSARISLLGCGFDETRCWDLCWCRWRRDAALIIDDVYSVYVDESIPKHIIYVHDNWHLHAGKQHHVSGDVPVVVGSDNNNIIILFSTTADDDSGLVHASAASATATALVGC